MPPSPCVKWAPPALSSKTSPESKQFFLYVFPQEKNSKKRMITETKAKQKKTTAKNLSCLFPKQKEFNWPSDFSLSLSFTTLLSYCSVFSNMHTFALHMWSRNKTFFIQNSLFINAWDSRILKEKRQKKINKNKQTSPCFYSYCAINCKNVPF